VQTSFGEVDGGPHSANTATDDQHTVYMIHIIRGIIVKFD
jgi:hypothetical protein